MKTWHQIATLDELERERHVVVRVGDREIGVVLDSDGSLRALRNRCPHHGAPLCLGSLRQRTSGAPGRYELTGKTVLRCPWHGWEFDLETGRCLEEDSLRVAVYPVRVEDGRVLVEA